MREGGHEKTSEPPQVNALVHAKSLFGTPETSVNVRFRAAVGDKRTSRQTGSKR
jgi:hypothetical protein